MAAGRKNAGGGKPSTTPNRLPSGISTGMAFLLLSMVGCLVKVRLADGSEWEGLFDSLQEGVLSLSLAKELGGQQRLEGMARWPLSQVLWIKGESIDLNECREGASSPRPLGGFQTDAKISQAGELRERSLTPWQADNASIPMNGLEEGEDSAPGNWDQFAVNASLFGVVTSFDESQYTTPLPDASTPGYAERAREAERIAQEIMSSSQGTSKINSWHLREERGEELDAQITEEDLYGAVIRSAEKGEVKKSEKQSWAAIAKSKSGEGKPERVEEAKGERKELGETKKSLVNMQPDPQALEQAIQSVEQSQKSLQRRLSQLSNEASVSKLNPEAAEWKPRVEAPPFVPSAPVAPRPIPATSPPYHHYPSQSNYYRQPIPPVQNSYGVYMNGLFVPNYMLNPPAYPPPSPHPPPPPGPQDQPQP